MSSCKIEHAYQAWNTYMYYVALYRKCLMFHNLTFCDELLSSTPVWGHCYTPFQLCFHWCHIDSWRSIKVGVFTQQKYSSATNQRFLYLLSLGLPFLHFRNPILKHSPTYHYLPIHFFILLRDVGCEFYDSYMLANTLLLYTWIINESLFICIVWISNTGKLEFSLACLWNIRNQYIQYLDNFVRSWLPAID